MDKKAVLVVSFGTSHRDALQNNIEPIEREIAAALPGYEFRRAFTSGMIIRKIAERDGEQIDDVSKALERLRDEGFEQIVIQPTHILMGDEYHKLINQAEAYRSDFKRMSIGMPLLCSEEDFEKTADAIFKTLSLPEKDEAIVFMGHGTGHHANGAYAQLEYVFRDKNYTPVFIGTVEGYPRLEHVVKQLKSRGDIRKIRLLPLMIVAGDHAKSDMAGQEDSWNEELMRRGYETECFIRGLGEYPEIRQILVQHAKEAGEAS